MHLLACGDRILTPTDFGQIMTKLHFHKTIENHHGHVPDQESDIGDRKYTPQRCF